VPSTSRSVMNSSAGIAVRQHRQQAWCLFTDQADEGVVLGHAIQMQARARASTRLRRIEPSRQPAGSHSWRSSGRSRRAARRPGTFRQTIARAGHGRSPDATVANAGTPSQASAVSITWLSTYSVDPPRKCA
jgi:hypothetical protein